MCSQFGDAAARIFMLLLDKHHLEDKSISEFGLISKKQAKSFSLIMMFSFLNSVQIQSLCDDEFRVHRFTRAA
jgi:hypothetical protein